MFGVALKKPRGKKGPKGHHQPLFPIELTGVVYEGHLIDSCSSVSIESSSAADTLHNRGHFGTFCRDYHNSRDSLTSLKSVEPEIRNLHDNTNEPVVSDEEESGRVKAEQRRQQKEEEEEDKGQRLVLDLYEAYFLCYALGCLTVDGLAIELVAEKFVSLDAQFVSKYVVYHHYRSRGWVVRSGLKFGADFLLYQDGPSFYHASYSIRILRQTMNWTQLGALNRVTQSAAKELVLVTTQCDATRCVEGESAAEHLKHWNLEEMLVRRFVPGQNIIE